MPRPRLLVARRSPQRVAALGRFETLPWLATRSPTYGLAQVPSTDLDIPIFGQLAPSKLPLGDAPRTGSAERRKPRRSAQEWAAPVVSVETRAAGPAPRSRTRRSRPRTRRPAARRSSGRHPRSRRSVQPSTHPRLRLIPAHLEYASGGLDFRPDAPPGNECAREGGISKVDRDRVIQHAPRSRGHHLGG